MRGRIGGPVLLTGATGLLGSWLRRTAPADTDLVSVLHRRRPPGRSVAADLRDPASTTALARTAPALIIHAAFARDEASIVDATRHVVRAAREAGADLIYISSEAVFAGDGHPRSELSIPNPVWDYGRWKWEAENITSASDERAAMVRLPLIVSLDPEDHVLSGIRAARTRDERSVWFRDEIRQPACADDLARAIWRIAALPSAARAGPWHLPGVERLSRFEIAERAVAAANLDPSSITAAVSETSAHRPRDLNLTGGRAEHEIGWTPRPIYRPPSDLVGDDGPVEARHPNHRPWSSLPAELRDADVPRHVRAWVADVAGASVVRVARLDGASSVALHRVDLSDGRSLALRRYVWSGYIEAEPDAPVREVDAIRFARQHGLPVPDLVACDVTGHDIGDGVPLMLTALLPGEPVAVPDLELLAETAAAVHAVDAQQLGHEYFPWYEDEMVAPPPLATRPDVWEHAIELWRSAVPAYRPTFIHRDFHPGNLLWSHGRLTGIVDWAAACQGPVGCDIAHCRANLRDLATPEVADDFVSAYRSLTGYELDPFWVMAGHLEHRHAHWTPERIAVDEPDLEQAVRSLTS